MSLLTVQFQEQWRPPARVWFATGWYYATGVRVYASHWKYGAPWWPVYQDDAMQKVYASQDGQYLLSSEDVE